MDISIINTFSDNLNIELIKIIISNSYDREVMSKIEIRPVLLKEKLYFQVCEYRGKKVIHYNYEKQELLGKLENWFERKAEYENQVIFKQAEFESKNKRTTMLISKKGKVSIKVKKQSYNGQNKELGHNRSKNYILREGMNIPFLVELGVMTKEGKIVNSKYDKFRQINRFLEFIDDILENLSKDKKIKIIDFGCGKSYLTFAMYYFLTEINKYEIEMIGLDLKEDVISDCNRLAEKYNYKNLRFLHGDIASFEEAQSVDMVVTLHACDTATDYALNKAVMWGAKVILSVPCCQHEINKQIQNDILEPVLKYGLIKERMSALITDAVRADLLEACGYKTQILEFIDMEHTPKNIMIRGVKTGNNRKSISNIEKLMDFLNIEPTLYKLMKCEEEI